MATPTFSVIIPTYNRGDFLREAIQSVLNQTWQDFEIIVVDDASPEAIEPVVRAFADARIRFERNSANRGPGYSRNRGVALARGELISFLDSDDTFLPTFLEESRAVLHAAPADVGFIWTGYRVEQDGQVLSECIWTPEKTGSQYDLFLFGSRIGAGCGITLRAAAAATIQFDDRLRAAEDTEFFLRFVQRYQFSYVPKTLISIRRHAGARVTHNVRETLYTYVKILSSHRAAVFTKRELKLKYIEKLTTLAYQSRRKVLARKFFRWALPEGVLAPRLLLKILRFELVAR